MMVEPFTRQSHTICSNFERIEAAAQQDEGASALLRSTGFQRFFQKD